MKCLLPDILLFLSVIMDKRIIKTRENIYNSFITLLNKKAFDQITVKDIITEANIGRSTFYAHFEAKDDLLEQVCKTLFEHTFLHRDVPTSAYEMTAHIYYHFRKNKDKVKTLLLANNAIFNHHFSNYLLQYLYPLIIHDMRQAYPHLPETYLTHFFETSFIATLKWWLETVDDYTEKEVATYFLSVIFANQLPTSD